MIVLGKSKKPRCFKDVSMSNFSVNNLQQQQQNARMNVENFTKWFNDVFVPAIKKKKIRK